MKYSISHLAILALLLAACQSRQEAKTKQVEKTSGDTLHAGNSRSAARVNNEVRSEAPDASTQTEQGYALPRFDDGMAQSPINILSSEMGRVAGGREAIKFDGEIDAVENLGHTVQLDFSPESTTTINGEVNNFKQLHFHTPSEHLIDGMTFPMEMHIVNMTQETNKGDSTRYVVIGVLFKMGHENKFIKEFLNSIPKEENKKENLPRGTVRLQDVFGETPKKGSESYYHYTGSLTTPPFTESVNWMIRKNIFEASPEQIAAIEKIEGNNARHVQAMYDRRVAN